MRDTGSNTSPKSRLASNHARRRSRHLLISVVGLLLFVPAYVLGRSLMHHGVVTPLFAQTILLCIVAYLVCAYLIDQAAPLPDSDRRTVLLLTTLIPYPLLVLGFAALQQPYSRAAVALMAGLTIFWFWINEQLWQRQIKLRLVCFDERAWQDLRELVDPDLSELERRIEAVPWRANEPQPQGCDGALVSNQHALSEAQTQQLAQLKQQHLRLYSAGAVYESITGRKNPHEINNPLWQPDGNPFYDGVKRLTDLLLVIITTPVWVPLGLLVAIAVRLDSKGSALFTQTRIGLFGRPFKIYKFRTMVFTEEAAAKFAQTNDTRITRLGQFLRKTRLDEIPQLVNVLFGQMSLIGPRPEQHDFVKRFAINIPNYPYRHLVRPGLTGWAQVTQGYAASEEETSVKLSYDLYYVSHYCLAMDMLIIVKTIKTLLTGHGAR